MKYVYIVTGEHDGFIGAYSNFKKASFIAKEYAAGAEDVSKVTISDQSNEWNTFYSDWSKSDVERTIVQ